MYSRYTVYIFTSIYSHFQTIEIRPVQLLNFYLIMHLDIDGYQDLLKMYNVLMIFLLQIKEYEKLESHGERQEKSKEIYDNFIMKELLARTHVSFLLIA